MSRRITPLISALVITVSSIACSPTRHSRGTGGLPARVRLAYFPNVTHAVALVATARGTFKAAFGPNLPVEAQVFNAGPAEIEALFADQVDIGYIGPGPALNGFLKSRGRALKIIAGASSGGAALVVRAGSGISAITELDGKRAATPQIGGTQDISLRHWLREAGLVTTDRGGSVSVIPIASSDLPPLFIKKEIDAAWVPEPWVSVLVQAAGAEVLIDEREQWPYKEFASTVLIVRTQFLQQNPALVNKVIEAHLDTLKWMKENPEAMRKLVAQEIERLTGTTISEEVLKGALSRTDFTYDPLSESVRTFADRAQSLGYQRMGREALEGLFDLQALNTALTKRGLKAVK